MHVRSSPPFLGRVLLPLLSQTRTSKQPLKLLCVIIQLFAMFKQGNAIVKFVKDAYGTQTLLDALKAGGWKIFFDGTLA